MYQGPPFRAKGALRYGQESNSMPRNWSVERKVVSFITFACSACSSFRISCSVVVYSFIRVQFISRKRTLCPQVHQTILLRRSASATGVFQWRRREEGNMTTSPWAISTASFRSSNTRWPPFVQSWLPNTATAQRPYERLPLSLCIWVTTCGLTLKVVADQGDCFQYRCGCGKVFRNLSCVRDNSFPTRGKKVRRISTEIRKIRSSVL